eukprot:4581532-Pyramimonas_sp.AAC.1
MPTSRAKRPLPRAPVSTSAGRRRVPGTRPWASSSAPGSQTLAAACTWRATAWCPRVDSARQQQRACDPARSRTAWPQRPHGTGSSGPAAPTRRRRASGPCASRGSRARSGRSRSARGRRAAAAPRRPQRPRASCEGRAVPARRGSEVEPAAGAAAACAGRSWGARCPRPRRAEASCGRGPGGGRGAPGARRRAPPRAG